MELDLLLEQHAELTKRIQNSIHSIKNWFKNKIDECRELFKRTKEKIVKKFEKVTEEDFKKKKLKENIKDKSGHIVAKKGENAESVFKRFKSVIMNLLVKLKNQCDKIIRDCQRGIRHLIGISDSKLAERNLIIIEEHKKSVVEEINNTATTVALIANIISSISIMTYTAVKANKFLNNMERNKSERKQREEKGEAIEVEFSVV